MPMEKYVGHTVEIIYVDAEGRFTQRKITVRSVIDGRVRAYDHSRRAFRVFKASNILARKPVNGHAS
ncbi:MULTISPECIES: hypothetical protein [Cohnella]|uniref:hypothetical protein n=1 Tax=Cohnella TaxID=329857 RepID=UPI001F074EE0|nr:MULTISPECIES: hypothetical protein [Cohnella]